MNTPDPAAVLEAAHLEALEEAARGAEVLPEGSPLTLPDVVEALRRIRYHQGKIAQIESEANCMIAPLLFQIDQIKAWVQDRVQDRQQSIQFHEGRLIMYARLNPPAKGKTVELPGGKVSCRDQQPKWLYQDEAELLRVLQADGHPAARTEVTVKLDKPKLKQLTQVRDDGTVACTVTGQIIPGVRVEPQPPVFKVEVIG